MVLLLGVGFLTAAPAFEAWRVEDVPLLSFRAEFPEYAQISTIESFRGVAQSHSGRFRHYKVDKATFIVFLDFSGLQVLISNPHPLDQFRIGFYDTKFGRDWTAEEIGELNAEICQIVACLE